MADTQDNGKTPIAEQAKQQAQEAVQQGKQTAGHLWELGRTQFRAQLTAQKDRAATSLQDMAELIRQTGVQLQDQGHTGSSGYAAQAADRLEALSTNVQGKDINEIISDTENFARRRPAAFLSIAALLGFLLSRFLKSSGAATAAA